LASGLAACKGSALRAEGKTTGTRSADLARRLFLEAIMVRRLCKQAAWGTWR